MYSPQQSQILDTLLAGGTIDSYGLDPQSEHAKWDKAIRWDLIKMPDWRIEITDEGNGKYTVFSWHYFAAGKAEPQWFSGVWTSCDYKGLSAEVKRRVQGILKGEER